MKFSNGFLKANKGPFAGNIFFAAPHEDALNRIHFKILTWHGEEAEEDWEQGGWWHANSVLWDDSGVQLYTDVTYFGSDLEAQYPWPKSEDEQEEQRLEDLYNPEKAWEWVSEVLSEPLGLELMSKEEAQDENPSFQKELKVHGVAKRLE